MQYTAGKSASPAESSGSFNINKIFVSDIVSVKQYPSSLNRHGYTFQCFSNGVALTRPERIKFSSTHHSGTTDHGGTSAHDRSVELISNINFEESDLDMYLFSDYNLFPEKIQITEPYNEISTGSRSELTETPFNPDYYKLAFLD